MKYNDLRYVLSLVSGDWSKIYITQDKMWAIKP